MKLLHPGTIIASYADDMKLRWHRQYVRAIQGLLCGCLVLSVAGCGKPLIALNRLAASGSIDNAAPVTAHVQIDVHAPVERVWAVLVDLPSWPKWQRGVESVSGSPLSPNSSFEWTTGGTRIHSNVLMFEPSHRLSWTGKAYTAKAVHVWTLTAIAPDQTRVAVDESMEGLLMTKLFSSQQLREADTEWVNALKRQAEAALPR